MPRMGTNLVSSLGKLVAMIGFYFELALFAGPNSQIFTSSHLLSRKVWANQLGSRKRLVELFTIKNHRWNKSDNSVTVWPGKDHVQNGC